METQGPNNLAIRPYPNQWEPWIGTDNGFRVFIRPVRPADEHLYGAFIDKLSPEDIRFRFLTPRKEFSHKLIARFTQIDYARAMAFVALDKDQKELLGVARLAADPDYVTGEYAVIVRSDLKGTGIGWALMRHLIRYAEKEGLRELSATCWPAISACWRCVARSASRSPSIPRTPRSAKCGSSSPLDCNEARPWKPSLRTKATSGPGECARSGRDRASCQIFLKVSAR